MVERQVAGLQAEWGAQSVPVLLWDESFSTRRAVGSPYRARGKASVASHAAAAAIVLEEVLHALRPLESELADEGEPG